MNFENEAAVVTGAGSGIGLATASAFAGAGARVAVADIDAQAGDAAARSICDAGGEARFFQVDVTDQRSVDALRGAVLEWQPAVGIVANVAGWGKVQPFVENTPDFWRKVVDLNLMGPIGVTRAFLDGMIERNSGKVVVVSSDAGRVGSLGETVYAAAKGGAIAFTKSLAREMARFGINVNCVCPGPTDTPLLAAVPEKHREAFIRATPMRRLGKPHEVADAVLFLASDRASFITGQVLSVNGGLAIVG
jgi:2-hydroxycyclohexanecarboxyl-CoA dehydrogenase